VSVVVTQDGRPSTELGRKKAQKAQKSTKDTKTKTSEEVFLFVSFVLFCG